MEGVRVCFLPSNNFDLYSKFLIIKKIASGFKLLIANFCEQLAINKYNVLIKLFYSPSIQGLNGAIIIMYNAVHLFNLSSGRFYGRF